MERPRGQACERRSTDATTRVDPVQLEHPLRCIHADDRSDSLHPGPSRFAWEDRCVAPPWALMMPSARGGPPRPHRRSLEGKRPFHSRRAVFRGGRGRGPAANRGPELALQLPVLARSSTRQRAWRRGPRPLTAGPVRGYRSRPGSCPRSLDGGRLGRGRRRR